MGYTKSELLSRLEELHIKVSKYEHPVVLTVEAQAKYVGHLEGALSKNLFLKDKKQRFYIVSALAETKVDLKVLSQRLGLGKGGIRMAPEEALAEILQVPLGCVTPFSLINESGRNVSLLLDQGFRAQKCCFFHPLSNDASISISASDLDKFLTSIGKTPAYVDLESNPTVGKDQPPDLAALVPPDSIAVVEPLEKQGSSQPSENKNARPAANEEKGAKHSKVVPAKVKSPEAAPKTYANSDECVEEIIGKVTSVVISEIKDGKIENKQEQFASVLSRQLEAELKNILTMFKNTAYTEGFAAGIHHQPKRL